MTGISPSKVASCHKQTHRAATQTSRCQKAFIHPIHILMITVFVDNYNPISQKFYDSVLHSVQFHRLICPSCGHSACLTVHGYYTRHLKTAEGSLSLRICRLYCSCCSHTHAILPSCLVPYSQVSLPEHMQIVQAYEDGGSLESVMVQNPSIDESNCRYIIRKYLSYWKQRLLSEQISLTSDGFIVRCFQCFLKQFMQIHRTPNILFINTT